MSNLSNDDHLKAFIKILDQMDPQNHIEFDQIYHEFINITNLSRGAAEYLRYKTKDIRNKLKLQAYVSNYPALNWWNNTSNVSTKPLTFNDILNTGNQIKGLGLDPIFIDGFLTEEFDYKDIEDKEFSHQNKLFVASLLDINYNSSTWKALMVKIPLINFNSIKEREKLLQFYIEIFDEIPSMAHSIRAFNLMEKIVLEKYRNSQIQPNEKSLLRFDKCKNLALTNENINEKKLAFYRAVKIFIDLADVKELKIPEGKV